MTFGHVHRETADGNSLILRGQGHVRVESHVCQPCPRVVCTAIGGCLRLRLTEPKILRNNIDVGFYGLVCVEFSFPHPLPHTHVSHVCLLERTMNIPSVARDALEKFVWEPSGCGRQRLPCKMQSWSVTSYSPTLNTVASGYPEAYALQLREAEIPRLCGFLSTVCSRRCARFRSTM